MRHPFEAPAVAMQACIICSANLPLDAFPLDPKRKSGHAYVCRDCRPGPEPVVAPPAPEPAPEPTTKLCAGCKQELPLDAFSPGLRAQKQWGRCRDCENAINRAKRQQRRARLVETTGDGPACSCCDSNPCRPDCLRSCPDCRDLSQHPRCQRCEILVGAHHFEKKLVGGLCGGCAQELPSGVSYRQHKRTADWGPRRAR